MSQISRPSSPVNTRKLETEILCYGINSPNFFPLLFLLQLSTLHFITLLIFPPLHCISYLCDSLPSISSNKRMSALTKTLPAVAVETLDTDTFSCDASLASPPSALVGRPAGDVEVGAGGLVVVGVCATMPERGKVSGNKGRY